MEGTHIGVTYNLSFMNSHQIRVAFQGMGNSFCELLQRGNIIFKGDSCLFYIRSVNPQKLFGILFLLPPTRAVVRALLVRRFARRMMVSVAGSMPGMGGPGRGPAGHRSPTGQDYDVDGTAHEVRRGPDRLQP